MEGQSLIPLTLRLRARYRHISGSMVISIWFITDLRSVVTNRTLSPSSNLYQDDVAMIAQNTSHAEMIIHDNLFGDLYTDITPSEEEYVEISTGKARVVMCDYLPSDMTMELRPDKGRLHPPKRYIMRILNDD